MEYHKKLYMLRMLRELTRPDMADAIGVCLKTYARYESGEKFPDLTKETQILNALELTRNEFDNFDIQKIFEGLKDSANRAKQLEQDIVVKFTRRMKMLEKRIEQLESKKYI